MMDLYIIFEEQIDGSACKCWRTEAETKEEAVRKYLENVGLSFEKDAWRYYAKSSTEIKVSDEEKAKLKEAGCSSWEEYYDDMYPSRPIEL